MSFRCPCCGHTVTAAVPREELAGHFSSKVFSRVVRRLAWRPGLWVQMPDLVDAVYGDDAEGGPLDPMNVIRRQIFRSQDRLVPLGWRLEHGRGTGQFGYRLVLAVQSDG